MEAIILHKAYLLALMFITNLYSPNVVVVVQKEKLN